MRYRTPLLIGFSLLLLAGIGIGLSQGFKTSVPPSMIAGVEDDREDALDTEAPIHPGRQGRGQRGTILSQLKLSPQQIRQLQAARRQYQPKIREKTRQIYQERRTLNTLLASNAPDEAVQAQFQKLQQLRQEVQQLRFQSVLALRQILSVEQRQTFLQLREHRRSGLP